MDVPCHIRKADRTDLGAVAQIEAAVFPDPWSVAAFGNHLRDLFLVAEQQGEVVAYLIARVVQPEAEILNVAVSPGHRRRGIARQLLNAALAELRAFAVEIVFLEVRPSNAAALRLYAESGFAQVGVRRGYYQTPPEDAAVLRLHLVGRGQPA